MSVFNVQKLKILRRNIHQYPEIGFNQFNTQKKIIDCLLSIGVPETIILKIAKTGLMIDLQGKGKSLGQKRTIAFRADIDALSVQEANQNLKYRSKIPNIGHLCGHDGHTIWLLGFAMKFIDNAEKIPQNVTFRLLFQPSQQGPQSGSKAMINQGCLNGVDEIYGVHNYPMKSSYNVWIDQGPVLSEANKVYFKIIGTSGHTSEPYKVKDALKKGIQFYNDYTQYNNLLSKNYKFVACIPVFHCGQRFNVFSQQCILQGTVRSFSVGLIDKIRQNCQKLQKEIQLQGFKTMFNVQTVFHMIQNHPKQASYVRRAAQKCFGPQKVGKGKLPLFASDDFSEFLRIVPGAYFIITTSEQAGVPFSHDINFDFNDDYIQKGADMWWSLALDRALEQEGKI